MKCRHCKITLTHELIDLGICPPSNAYVKSDKLSKHQTTYPLKVKICKNCYLVQTEDYTRSKTFFNDNYAYLSSISKTWQKHCKDFSKKIIKLLSLDNKSLVLEIASNDGCLIENFKKKRIKSIGVEPTKLAAKISQKKGIYTIQKFFNLGLAKKILKTHGKADLVCANNVFAHVPNINDFVKSLKLIISNNGVITLEFPHLLNLIKNTLFDTIYHEHIL